MTKQGQERNRKSHSSVSHSIIFLEDITLIVGTTGKKCFETERLNQIKQHDILKCEIKECITFLL